MTLAIAISVLAVAHGSRDVGGIVFQVARRAEVLARITVDCEPCAWDVEGREAITLRLTVDDDYSQHLPIVRSGRAEYRVMLGSLEAGEHHFRYFLDSELTAEQLPDSIVSSVVQVDIG